MDRANYTMFFYQYIEAIGGQENLPTELQSFPQWESQNFIDRFIERFKYREIGSETVELFSHNLKMCTNEAISIYKRKLQLQLDNFDDLYKRTVKESGFDIDEDYFNPINSQSQKMITKSKNEYEREKTYGYIYSNVQIMEQVEKVNIIFEDILNYFERLFMAVL